ncbi:MAG TPA: MazG-like family protein [Actinocrinis sp.]|nr:MazG-like family protein [Actinocrinis sp.]
MDDRTWDTVARLVDWLDSHSRDNAVSPEVTRLLRVMKLSEEVGETTQAVIGALAANPRKGLTHTWRDVEHELCDVIVTAMVALATLNPQARAVFAQRLEHVAARSLS